MPSSFAHPDPTSTGAVGENSEGFIGPIRELMKTLDGGDEAYVV